MTTPQTMSPEHQNTLKAMEAARAAGEDPLGDEDPLEFVEEEEFEEAADDEGAIAAAGKQPGDDDGKPADAAADAAATDEPTAAPAPQEFAVDAKDFKAERVALRTKESEIDAKWAAGELTDEERGTQLATVRDDLDALLVEQTRASTISEINHQNRLAEQAKVIDRLRAEGTKGGLDYSNTGEHADQFDLAMQVLLKSPAWKGKSFDEMATQAHATVMALNGKVAVAAPAPAERNPIAPRTTPTPPVTLRNLPAAQTPHSGGDEADALGRLDGQAYQSAFAKLSPAAKARLLDE